MSGQGCAKRNLSSFFANSFSPLDLFKADCEAEELVQGLHLICLMKDTGFKKDSAASGVPRVCYESPTSSTSEAGLFIDQGAIFFVLYYCQVSVEILQKLGICHVRKPVSQNRQILVIEMEVGEPTHVAFLPLIF